MCNVHARSHEIRGKNILIFFISIKPDLILKLVTFRAESTEPKKDRKKKWHREFIYSTTHLLLSLFHKKWPKNLFDNSSEKLFAVWKIHAHFGWWHLTYKWCKQTVNFSVLPPVKYLQVGKKRTKEDYQWSDFVLEHSVGTRDGNRETQRCDLYCQPPASSLQHVCFPRLALFRCPYSSVSLSLSLFLFLSICVCFSFPFSLISRIRGQSCDIMLDRDETRYEYR